MFYSETEYFDLLESCISNLQFLFKISKQKSLSFLQKNNYDLCNTINDLNEDQKINKNMQNLFLDNNIENKLLDNSKINNSCLICDESNTQLFFFGRECSHKFCEDCYKNYLTAIMDSKGFRCFPSNCPMEGCNVKF